MRKHLGLHGAIASLATAIIAPSNVAIREVGTYDNRSGTCPVRITVSARGSFSQLHLPTAMPPRKEVVRDVTALIFLEGHQVIYSVSPIYGKPGIFIFDCVGKKIRRIVTPRSFNSAYPDGTDYFELQTVRNGRIQFYHAADVDAADFETLRTRSHLYEVTLDGSNLRKAP